MLKSVFLAAVFLLLGYHFGYADGGSQQYLTKEPPTGALPSGQVVLVDDGTCPAGQIKQVTGGNGSAAAGGTGRQRKCIPKPPQ
ncbi:MAG: hypothetical protein P4L54_04795 [Acidocella sp.]|nr:hypothetical protein [Acidocella sp.]